MYRTRDGQSFKSLDSLARTITHRAPDTTWRAVDSGLDPYWVPISVERMRGPVQTVYVPRGVFLSWLRDRKPRVIVKRLRAAR